MIAPALRRLDAGVSLGVVRGLQQQWAAVSLKERLEVVRRFRHELAARAADFQSKPELLVAQWLPLADAARFLEKEAPYILASQRLAANGRPFWMRGVEIEQIREPFGVVLIIAPSNYPYFLPGVQVLQALTAGNAVVLKPGCNGRPAALELQEMLETAGLPPELLVVLDESPAAAEQMIVQGVDKVVLTGSAETGRVVLKELAPHLTPCTMELSGDDPVIVRADADLELVAKALNFGMTLNRGKTCIAPRRIFVARQVSAALENRLPEGIRCTPFDTDDEAVRLAGASPFALGASVFGQEPAASELARRIRAGVVVVNDMIVPTADPRLPFGGRGDSGFGVTRGAEGLRDLTVIKTIVTRRGGWRPHLESQKPGDAELFCAYIEVAHGGSIIHKPGAVMKLLRALFRRMKS